MPARLETEVAAWPQSCRRQSGAYNEVPAQGQKAKPKRVIETCVAEARTSVSMRGPDLSLAAHRQLALTLQPALLLSQGVDR